jgi:hypothetical protein
MKRGKHYQQSNIPANSHEPTNKTRQKEQTKTMTKYIDIVNKAWDDNKILGLALILFITAAGILADCELPNMAFASVINAMVIFGRLLIKYLENGHPESRHEQL